MVSQSVYNGRAQRDLKKQMAKFEILISRPHKTCTIGITKGCVSKVTNQMLLKLDNRVAEQTLQLERKNDRRKQYTHLKLDLCAGVGWRGVAVDKKLNMYRRMKRMHLECWT